ncbi:MAG: aminoglycoside adenylyltransferase [Devosia sp.]|nr:aminoglycoside adenylyltransferase [Devosia sp.]
MTYTLRRVGVADTDLFETIAVDVFDEPVDTARLAVYLSAPGHLMILALEAGTVIGQCAAVVHHHPDKTDELYIDEVGTATAHLRRGVARAMLGEMFAWGRELGCTEAWLGTELANDAANGLYRHLDGREDTIKYYEFTL